MARAKSTFRRPGFPHPVLGHELAHVVAGAFGRGPFKIAGLLSGLVPDPGRIEGVATAAAPDENDALTLEEWAAAMQKLELLPKLESLFRLSFFGHNAAQAYTAAGAFVRYLQAEFGAASVRRWYAGEPLEAVTQAAAQRARSALAARLGSAARCRTPPWPTRAHASNGRRSLHGAARASSIGATPRLMRAWPPLISLARVRAFGKCSRWTRATRTLGSGSLRATRAPWTCRARSSNSTS
ncbi:MAG: hypothetical protein QM756_11835 [Polyangiaceae bacterium]